MEHFTKEDRECAKKTLEFYLDLVENNIATLKYSLADNIVLDWFGKTIKDKKKVVAFMKEEMVSASHRISNPCPAENVAFKDTHHVKVAREKKLKCKLSPSPSDKESTPPKVMYASTSMMEMGQGDGPHNLVSPRKKIKLTPDDDEIRETLEDEIEPLQLKYVTARGSVEFHRPSMKKLQNETKWERPVKLHLGYTSSSFKECTIYLIIYEGNLKCRRNLYKEFCESSS